MRRDIKNPGKLISTETAVSVLAELKRQDLLEPVLNMLRDFSATWGEELRKAALNGDWAVSKKEVLKLGRIQGRADAGDTIVRRFVRLAADNPVREIEREEL